MNCVWKKIFDQTWWMHRNHFPTKSTGILHLWISDGDGDEVVGSLVLILFFLLPLCVLLAVHPSPTVALSLSLLLVWFWRWNCREEQVSTYGIKLCSGMIVVKEWMWCDESTHIQALSMWWDLLHRKGAQTWSYPVVQPSGASSLSLFSCPFSFSSSSSFHLILLERSKKEELTFRKIITFTNKNGRLQAQVKKQTKKR